MIGYSRFRDPRWVSYAPALQMLKNWCRSKSVELLDLTDRFSTEPAGDIYFPGNVHLKEKGDAVAAAAIADEIIAHYSPQVKTHQSSTSPASSATESRVQSP